MTQSYMSYDIMTILWLLQNQQCNKI